MIDKWSPFDDYAVYDFTRMDGKRGRWSVSTGRHQKRCGLLYEGGGKSLHVGHYGTVDEARRVAEELDEGDQPIVGQTWDQALEDLRKRNT